MHKYKVGDTGTYRQCIFKILECYKDRVGIKFTITDIAAKETKQKYGQRYTVRFDNNNSTGVVYESEMKMEPLIKRDIPWL